MKRATLRVRSRDAVDLLAVVTWIDGRVIVESAEPAFERVLRSWLAHGLTEVVGEPPEQLTRETRSTEAEFLPRIAEHLQRTTGFITHLRETEVRQTRATDVNAIVRDAVVQAIQRFAFAMLEGGPRRSNVLIMHELEQREVALYPRVAERLRS